jgi:hypothetical protein
MYWIHPTGGPQVAAFGEFVFIGLGYTGGTKITLPGFRELVYKQFPVISFSTVVLY